MNARQNFFSRFESFMQRLIEGPFAWLFPSRAEPVELMRKLERAMEDNTLLQGEGRRLVPNVYDIYLSIKDHQQISTTQTSLIRDWQQNLVEFARQKRFVLRTYPMIRIHADTKLRTGLSRIETEMVDTKTGHDSTQQLSADQLAQLQSQLAQAPQAQSPSSPNQMQPVGGGYTSTPLQQPMPEPIPPAWFTIRLPQGGQQVYPIEKSIVNIGRQLSNDIIVEDKRVSRYHAQIKFQDGQFVLFDLGSTNGITVNQTPHMRHHVMRNGDTFTIGSYDFFFERR